MENQNVTAGDVLKHYLETISKESKILEDEIDLLFSNQPTQSEIQSLFKKVKQFYKEYSGTVPKLIANIGMMNFRSFINTLDIATKLQQHFDSKLRQFLDENADSTLSS
ncbi:MAG: hypothetical protein A3D31_18485 [Candidatus Fluviicola riflensis]|nr:MAG: hypothetical protein CHH17_03675 [Candidatus Fluviicola riflensis]OGS76437.1 MAG: hypothetical protein A3D31_18485 [Candidatus Fluviicola riflensis]OGS82731.1 MAG: hypothetical protein A2724_13310 [Fluviicola sp. RIFCSPHIGHO2_01_FULL_43_53]OGS89030.1 MAG: hypothetical protein A3E30_16970 [Fluviicola sp. RIFCSPHIGHO2_12_FULL_43_24]